MDVAPVSVVIPAYNSEEFIGEAVSSVLTQTLRPSEIIVVDDGSTDRTAEVAAELGASVIRQPHEGISAARNAGIRAAKHEWIAFHDADDLWQPNKIEYQWEATRRHPDVGLVSCDLSQWIQGRAMPELLSAAAVADFDKSIVYIPRMCGDALADEMKYNSPTMLIRRELLLSVGLFDEHVQYVEGVECYLRVLARCSIALIQMPLVMQRLHQNNTSGNSVEMSLAWMRMVDQIAAAPERYPAGAAEALGRDVYGQLLRVGRKLLNQGRRREARDLFARSLRKKLSTRALWLWTLSFINPRAFDRLVKVKHKLKASA